MALFINHLLLLEDVRVFAEAELAEELREVCSFKGGTEGAAINARQRNAVHVITAAQILLTY